MPLRPATCPHCFREVFVNDDAICPACKGNTDEKGADHQNLTPVEFVDGEELPAICIVCAQPAQSYVVVGEKNETGKNSPVHILSRLAGAVAGLISIRIGPEPYLKEYKISVNLPVCASHREAKSLKPLHVDYRRYRMTIPAHAEFIKRWKNPGP